MPTRHAPVARPQESRPVVTDTPTATTRVEGAFRPVTNGLARLQLAHNGSYALAGAGDEPGVVPVVRYLGFGVFLDAWDGLSAAEAGGVAPSACRYELGVPIHTAPGVPSSKLNPTAT